METREHSPRSSRSAGDPAQVARNRAVLIRDAALARAASARRWMITGAAGLSALFAALVWALAPGHSLSSARAATSTPASSSATQSKTSSGLAAMPPAASAAALGLGESAAGPTPSEPAPPAPSSSPPAQAQAPAPAPAPAVSGGS